MEKKTGQNSFDVVVLAAGKGTRMHSTLPKVLHRAAGWPILKLIYFQVASCDCRRLIAVLGNGRERVSEAIASWNFSESMELLEVVQEQQNGTGDAIRVALPALEQSNSSVPIVILNGDAPLITADFLSAMVESHRKSQAACTLATMQLENPFGYGRVFSKGDQISHIVEEKNATEAEKKNTVVNGGIYVVELSYLQKYLPKITANPKTQEYYLTDLIALGSEAGEKVMAYEVEAEILQGVNDQAQLATASKVLMRRKCEEWMKKGVRMLAPDSCYIEQSVQCAAGATIEPNVMLIGDTEITEGAYIECGVRLENVKVAKNAHIKAYSCLADCVIGESSNIGPMARIRPGTEIGKQVKIGNFVEVKKSQFADGSKASHLSYIGDAEVGENVNIGCGFVACNYDGVNKHKTTIEADAFVGSGVQAVAPVTIGKGSYISTGSTINKNVPDGALAIARQRQENKEGYAKRLMGRKKKNKE